ncbi:dihydropteroate synthase [Roseivivax isoporae]|uniref:Dihydropteroate synthase n=1 Tax=Roseivivax isoporae LMG 25204 TaxID=1449351 RepID=X7FAL5_9RHOB|nr:dihydropteroate synthase [Roseivivax isoporae]ETX29763.1 dihydropteroate synthase [Roseivivax isoporae LMG 25204]
MTDYFRPLVQHGRHRPDTALPLAGGASWFTHALHLRRDAAPRVLPAAGIPADWQAALSAPRAPVAGLSMDAPRLMGILNVTPDSFSDGGLHAGPAAAIAHAETMARAGVDIVDVGGESTRPGASTIPEEEESARVAPVIERIARPGRPLVSIDTRKRAVAEAAVKAGAGFVNDVAGLTYDPGLAPFCAARALPVCIMHAQGDPATMQDAPTYGDVLLDVYDWLAARVAALEAQGIPRDRIVVDPGIGFGKTMAHNLALLEGVALFHGLGCPVLVGASRKRFIGVISGEQEPARRVPGSLAVALAAAAEGVQILRIHDVAETAAALKVWQATRQGRHDGT